MTAVVQRVKSASVSVDGKICGEIGLGFLVLLGVSVSDTEEDAVYLAGKISSMRIFDDESGKINLSVKDVGGSILAVSNFTLCADCRKGNRPNFINAARPQEAEYLYEKFVELVRARGIAVSCGQFGGEMLVSLVNDGPVTIVIDSMKRQ